MDFNSLRFGSFGLSENSGPAFHGNPELPVDRANNLPGIHHSEHHAPNDAYHPSSHQQYTSYDQHQHLAYRHSIHHLQDSICHTAGPLGPLTGTRQHNQIISNELRPPTHTDHPDGEPNHSAAFPAQSLDFNTTVLSSQHRASQGHLQFPINTRQSEVPITPFQHPPPHSLHTNKQQPTTQTKKTRKKTARSYVDDSAGSQEMLAPTPRESIIRFLNENSEPSQISLAAPPTTDSLMSKSTADIRKLAMEKSKKVMSKEDETFFFELYEKQQKEIAAAAVQRQVSVGMVENLLGRKQALREASGWNNFQKKHGALFRGKGKGVKGSGAMVELSFMWNSLSHDEKLAYQTEKDYSFGENSSPDCTGLRVNSESLKLAEKRVDNWMNEWQRRAAHIASSNHCEIVMFAVSNHLADYNFQNVRATAGAAEFVREICSADGIKNYQSRLQSFLTGERLNSISACTSRKSDTKTAHGSNTVSVTRGKLGDLVYRATNGLKDSWTWQGCDDTLGRLGYRVVFMPGAVSQPTWIKSYSSQLCQPQAKLINKDIDDGLIQVIQDEHALVGSSWIATNKTNSSHPMSNENEEDAGNPHDIQDSADDPDGEARLPSTIQPIPPRNKRKQKSKNQKASAPKRRRIQNVQQLTEADQALDPPSNSDSGERSERVRRFRPKKIVSLPSSTLHNNNPQSQPLQGENDNQCDVPSHTSQDPVIP